MQEQLDSFLAQTYENWILIGSDDGSRDASVSIFNRFKAGHPDRSILLQQGPRKGFVRNFQNLISSVPPYMKYAALSDQDDVWFPDKLERAVSMMDTLPPTCPAIYCAATLICDDVLRPLGQSARFKRSAKTAEMCKLVENSSRDVQIAFANELSIISDKFGIDVWELISLANRHPRVNILQPGAGVGGHCIAVDPWFIVASAPDEAKLIRAARECNDAKPDWVLGKGRDAVMEVLAADPSRAMKDVKVACLGLAFKPNIDDLRESPALDITQKFGKMGCQVLAVEPNIEKLPAKLADLPITLTSLDQALSEADIICVLVKHSAFADLMKKLPDGVKLVDVVGLTSK